MGMQYISSICPYREVIVILGHAHWETLWIWFLLPPYNHSSKPIESSQYLSNKYIYHKTCATHKEPWIPRSWNDDNRLIQLRVGVSNPGYLPSSLYIQTIRKKLQFIQDALLFKNAAAILAVWIISLNFLAVLLPFCYPSFQPSLSAGDGNNTALKAAEDSL